MPAWFLAEAGAVRARAPPVEQAALRLPPRMLSRRAAQPRRLQTGGPSAAPPGHRRLSVVRVTGDSAAAWRVPVLQLLVGFLPPSSECGPAPLAVCSPGDTQFRLPGFSGTQASPRPLPAAARFQSHSEAQVFPAGDRTSPLLCCSVRDRAPSAAAESNTHLLRPATSAERDPEQLS